MPPLLDRFRARLSRRRRSASLSVPYKLAWSCLPDTVFVALVATCELEDIESLALTCRFLHKRIFENEHAIAHAFIEMRQSHGMYRDADDHSSPGEDLTFIFDLFPPPPPQYDAGGYGDAEYSLAYLVDLKRCWVTCIRLSFHLADHEIRYHLETDSVARSMWASSKTEKEVVYSKAVCMLQHKLLRPLAYAVFFLESCASVSEPQGPDRIVDLYASIETQRAILQRAPFTDTQVIIQTQHCMHLLCSTVRRLMSPTFQSSTSENWVSLLLLTSTLERILEFFVAVSKDDERIDSSSHAANWTHRKEFLWRMREDLGHFMAATGQSTHQKPIIAPTFDLFPSMLDRVMIGALIALDLTRSAPGISEFAVSNGAAFRIHRGLKQRGAQESQVWTHHLQYRHVIYAIPERSEIVTWPTYIVHAKLKLDPQVKCDRQDPCMNCVDAHVECLRTRQTRVHRPRVSRLDALAERLARLEKTGHGAPNIASPVSLAANHEAIRSLPSPPKAHQYNQVSTSKRKYPTTNSSVSSSDFVQSASRQTPPTRLLKLEKYLDHELQCNPALSQDRRGALEAARKFVGQLSNPRFTRGAEVEEEFDTDEDLPRPTFTPELLYMMLPGADGVTNSQNLWIWPDHISSKTLERMGLAIIEGTENEHTLLYYRVIVWTKVITFLLGLIIVTPSEPLREHFKYLQRQYRAAAFRDLNSISVSAPPSLILLQALLSGVSPANPPLSWLSAYPCKKRLMQYLGNQSRCWMFVSYAAKVIVALGYHNITNTVPQDDVEDEIHACLYTCFYFDNTLSLLLLRPMSMPKLKVNPVDLVHMSGELPFKPIISGIVELACLKDTLLPILLGTTPMSAKEKANVLSDLMTQTKEVHSRLQVQRKHQELQFASAWGHLEGSWLSMDFNYYSTMTTIIRARSSVLKSRPQLFSTQVSDTGYPYFLTWTILLFPLTPFFVLFCNVVATSDHKDFEMMRNTTNDLRQFAEIHPPFRKLYGLFSKFMDLCAPLMENTQRPPSASLLPAQNGPNNAHLAPPYPDIYDRSVHQPNLLPSPIASKADSGAVEGWDDSLMWELFDNQPTIGWAESGLWDAMIQMGP
ncbi:hypothetical protein N7470_005010 [Penicillium chermesinum]|nr:hypothetical protein N7470_005010 [Penicillium chermesinum]